MYKRQGQECIEARRSLKNIAATLALRALELESFHSVLQEQKSDFENQKRIAKCQAAQFKRAIAAAKAKAANGPSNAKPAVVMPPHASETTSLPVQANTHAAGSPGPPSGIGAASVHGQGIGSRVQVDGDKAGADDLSLIHI